MKKKKKKEIKALSDNEQFAMVEQTVTRYH